MRDRKHRYNDDPSTRDVPLSMDEAAWLLDNPDAVKGRDAVRHLVSRTAATARQLRDARMGFDEEMRRRTSALPSRGVQSAISPEAAVRFLSPEQLSGLFDRLSQEKLAVLEHQRRTAATAMDEAAGLLRAVAEHPDTPAPLREQAAAALARAVVGARPAGA
jgi:hypothetical protein